MAARPSSFLRPGRRHQGAYPVIYLTLKDVKCTDWDDCLDKLKAAISKEFRRHASILDSGLLKSFETREFLTPIQSGYMHGYHDEVISFMRSLFGAALKDNPCLEKGILTGVLRLAKENQPDRHSDQIQEGGERKQRSHDSGRSDRLATDR